ncbi:polyhydroxyalkanoic acid system family protein [Aeromonas diversa]|uniref:polyhydroxyalkanoic acid system family protein n=1 Tax=Aeromonas diversa TaxID=502790 RepID=UPI0009D97904|nr:polyhydroxyalkanoic acid system family protein [Aeromonas diversa]
MFLYEPRSSGSLSSIQISRQHQLGLAGARLAAEAIAADLASNYQLDIEWTDEHELEFKGSGVDGMLTLGETHLELEVNLGLFLLPLRGTLEQEILEYMAHRIPCPAG